MKIKAYLSGPISGRDHLNIKEFRLWETKLEEMGLTVIVPHDITEDMPEDSSWSEFMKKDLAVLLTCDMVITLTDWYLSRGAKVEVGLARELGIPVELCHKITPDLLKKFKGVKDAA